MLKELEVISEILSYKLKWDVFFKNNFADSNESIINLNNSRNKIALSGYAPSIFSKMFGRNVSDEANFVFSTFNLMMGYIDDLIDNSQTYSDIKFILRNSENFFKGESGFNELLPLRNYLFDTFPPDDLNSFLNSIMLSGESAIYEAWATKPEDLKHSREIIGSCYVNILVDVINAYSDFDLSSKELNIIRNYTIGCTFLDNLSDVYQDRANGILTRSVIAFENGDFNSFFGEELKRVNNTYFILAKNLLKLLPNGDLGRFKAIENLAKTYYVSSFVKKKFHYQNCKDNIVS